MNVKNYFFLNRAKLLKVIARLDEHFGKPFDHLKDPPEILDVLIATKLSQNTTDKSSFKAYTNLKQKFGSWEKVASANKESIKECIKVCGLSNTKAKNIKEMLVAMKKKYGTLDLTFMKEYDNEKVYEEFLKYDGIGVKTISCVLIFAMGRDAFPVDTHVHRVLNRLGLVNTTSAEKTFEEIKDKIPDGKRYELHNNLIKFGRNICRSKNPLCSICFLYSLCKFPDKQSFRKLKSPENKTENNFIILEHL